MYVEGVERSSKWSYTSLLITFLIFNQFSKSFGKLRLRTLVLGTPHITQYAEVCSKSLGVWWCGHCLCAKKSTPCSTQ